MAGYGEKLQDEKLNIIIQTSDILFSMKTENKIFNRFFTEIFVSKMISKGFNKNFGEKK